MREIEGLERGGTGSQGRRGLEIEERSSPSGAVHRRRPISAFSHPGRDREASYKGAAPTAG
jgi:hypothetical protein